MQNPNFFLMAITHQDNDLHAYKTTDIKLNMLQSAGEYSQRENKWEVTDG